MKTILKVLSASVLILCALPARAQARWEQMDYGSFISASVTMPWATNGESLSGLTLKGITVKVGGKSAMSFDTDLLRWAGGWDGWLKLMGTPYDGTHRPPESSRPAAIGTLGFAAKVAPGIGFKGGFADPRKEPYGPLPLEWGKYRGLYVHGEKVVLSYTVGSCPVLELPGHAGTDAQSLFTRTLRMGPSKEPVEMVLMDPPANAKGPWSEVPYDQSNLPDAAIPGGRNLQLTNRGRLVIASLNLPAGATWQYRDQSVVLKLPALKESTLFTVALGDLGGGGVLSVDRLLAQESLPDPQTLIKGGPARFAQTVETKGKLGAKGGPYEVDLLTAPDENPWKSWMRFGGFDFFADGKRAAVCTWSGDVWIVSGIDEKLEKLTWRRYATGLFQPLGLKIIKDVIYVLGRDQITRLVDLNKDGEADFYENFNNDLTATPNFHEFVMDLQADSAGNFYFTKGSPLLGTDYFDPVSAHNGCVVKVSADGKKLETYATGLRAPNGAGVGPNGEVTCSDNEGIWTPVCRLNWVKRGGFYGCVGTAHRTPAPAAYDAPLCWLPFAVDNSAGGQVWVPDNRWGPFKGELLHLSYGKCALFHVLRQEVGGVMQGGVVKFPLAFESSVMRGRFSPADGQLYVAGLKGWQTTAARDGALHRVRYTGKPVQTVRAMEIQRDGVHLTFTAPLDKAAATDLQNFTIQQWNYKWSKDYGSSLYSVNDPAREIGKKGELRGEEVPITSARLSSNGKELTLKTGPLKPVMQMMIKAGLKTKDGAELPIEIYNTINKAPGGI